jgi:hypothetical protein
VFNVTQSFKATHAVITAAIVAGIFTAVTSPNAPMVVSAVATQAQSAAKTCDGTWPYLNCGQSGDQAVRVIRIN